MKKTLILLVLISLLPQASAAPDTAPTLTWESQVSQGFCPDAEAAVPGAIDLDQSENVYVVNRCSNSDSDDLVVTSFTSTGSIRWVNVIPAATTLNDRRLVGMTTDPGGRVVVWVQDSGNSNPNHQLVFMNGANGNILFSHADFDFDVNVPTGRAHNMVVKEVNATILTYYFSDETFRASVTCVNATSSGCSTDWQFSGTPSTQNSMTYGAPYIDFLYQSSEPSSSAVATRILNQDTGAVTTTSNPKGAPVWVSALDNSSAFLGARETSSCCSLRLVEIDSTTLVGIRDVQPIEPSVRSVDDIAIYSETNPSTSVLDGEDFMFYCGTVRNTGTSRSDGFISKYNTTASTGQRWNLTVSKNTGLNEENFWDCAIGGSGSIYGAFQSCATGSTNCDNYVRKYSGAGTARSQQNVFDAFPEPEAEVPIGSVDGALGFNSFCEAVGFTDAPGKFLCGLVIVLTGSVLVAFVLANRTEKGMARLGNVSLFGAGGTFFGLAIFVTVIDLWPTYTTIIMIILTAAVVTLVIKRQFISGGGD